MADSVRRIKATSITAAIALFLAVGLLAIVGAERPPSGASDLRAPPLDKGVTAPALALGKAYAAVAAHVKPAVVSIASERMVSVNGQESPFGFGEQFFRHFFGQGPQGQEGQQGRQFKVPEHSLGSGMIIDKEGHILTNYHVVENESKITVILADQRTFKAKVVGTDPKTDVAVIAITGHVPHDLPTVQLGNSDDLVAGDIVLAIGAPFGFVQTVTTGIISATGRANVEPANYGDFLQTDAPINPGNSGGPLVNMEGQVIGMNTAIATGVGQFSGVGFAIPVNVIKAILPILVKGGKVVRGYLGVYIQSLSPDLAQQFQVPSKKGALVAQVINGSPADEAGVRVGDVIVNFNGKQIKDATQLRNLVAATKPNEKANVTVLRNGKEQNLTVTVGTLPSGEQALAQEGGGGMLSRFGLKVETLTPETARAHGYGKIKGLLVTDVAPGSPAAEANVEAGDVITGVNHHRVADMEQLGKVLAQSKDKNRVLLLVNHNGQSMFVILQVQ
jgi:serine protease Do